MKLSDSSLIERLLLAGNPRDSWRWYSKEPHENVDYVGSCKLVPADVPDLITLATRWGNPDWMEFVDEDLLSRTDESLDLLPVTARPCCQASCTRAF